MNNELKDALDNSMKEKPIRPKKKDTRKNHANKESAKLSSRKKHYRYSSRFLEVKPKKWSKEQIDEQIDQLTQYFIDNPHKVSLMGYWQDMSIEPIIPYNTFKSYRMYNTEIREKMSFLFEILRTRIQEGALNKTYNEGFAKFVLYTNYRSFPWKDAPNNTNININSTGYKFNLDGTATSNSPEANDTKENNDVEPIF